MEKSSSSNDPPGRDLSLGCGSSSSTTNNTDAPDSSIPDSPESPCPSPPPSPSSPSTSASSPPAADAAASARSSSSSHNSALVSLPSPIITLNISTTTGGTFTVQVDTTNTVQALKKVVAKKLKVGKERICLLHRERELHDGTLQENGLMDGSKIILIPNVETGLLAQRPENTVMQALESLNDNQVNDFLSGKTPLNLSMRLGDHMMLIQLQLSTVTPTNTSTTGTQTQRSSRSSAKSRVSSASASSSAAGPSGIETPSATSLALPSAHPRCAIPTSNTNNAPKMIRTRRASSPAQTNHVPLCEYTQEELERLNTILNKKFKKFEESREIRSRSPPVVLNYSDDSQLLDQSPIKSLSNLVSSPIQTTPLKSYPSSPERSAAASPAPTPKNHTDDTSKFASCICKRLKTSDHCHADSATPSTSKQASLHRTFNNPIARKRQSCPSSSTKSASNFRRTKSSDSIQSDSDEPMPSTSHSHAESPVPTATSTPPPAPPGTLAEASRSLTQTLRKLSKEVFTNKTPEHTSRIIERHRAQIQSSSSSLQRKSSNSNASSAPGSGAVIESMKNHGKGIYSGTFSGTLNPALQDRNGRPKRDISTVIHILNDLLSATPHYTRGARICFEPSSTATTSTSTSSRSAKPTTSSSSASSSSHNPILSSNVQSSPTNCSKCNAELTAHRCQTGECAGHATEPSPNLARLDLTPAQRCRCSRALQFDDDDDTASLSSSPPTTPLGCHCPPVADAQSADEAMDDGTAATICTKCRAVERENSQTKNKLDQLRLVMQQKKARREARKLQTAPYSPTAGSAAARLQAAAASAATTAQNSSHAAAATSDPTTSPASSTGAGATTTATIASTAEVSASGTINNLIEEVVDTAA